VEKSRRVLRLLRGNLQEKRGDKGRKKEQMVGDEQHCRICVEGRWGEEEVHEPISLLHNIQ